MNYLFGLRNLKCLRSSPVLVKNEFSNAVRRITTSSKGSDITTVSVGVDAKPVVKKKVRSWKTYGYDSVDQVQDVFWMHATTFFFYTVLGCGVVFMLLYYPDINEFDWVEREAFLEIRRREVLGLPLINKDFIDPETVVLPPDEELEDDDIII